MDSAQALPPRTDIDNASGKRSLRTPLIIALAMAGTGALLWQLFGTANIFPTQATAPAAPPRPAAAANAPPAAHVASQPVSATPQYGTGLNIVPQPYRSWQVTPRPLPADKSETASNKPAADATPAARNPLPMQTAVGDGRVGDSRAGDGKAVGTKAGGKAVRIGVAAHPAATGGSGSSTRPGNADPNG
jgi:hypothetical protein